MEIIVWQIIAKVAHYDNDHGFFEKNEVITEGVIATFYDYIIDPRGQSCEFRHFDNTEFWNLRSQSQIVSWNDNL